MPVFLVVNPLVNWRKFSLFILSAHPTSPSWLRFVFLKDDFGYQLPPAFRSSVFLLSPSSSSAFITFYFSLTSLIPEGGDGALKLLRGAGTFILLHTQSPCTCESASRLRAPSSMFAAFMRANPHQYYTWPPVSAALGGWS